MARRYINHQENKNPHYKIKPRLKANSGKTLMMECANKSLKYFKTILYMFIDIRKMWIIWYMTDIN